jgi:hypothetical protein
VYEPAVPTLSFSRAFQSSGIAKTNCIAGYRQTQRK